MNRRTLIASFLGILPAVVLGLPVDVLGKTKKTDVHWMYKN